MFAKIVSRSRDYWQLLRFDKPIGILLLLWPTMSALWLASSGKPSARLVAIFISGTVIMRAAGCVMNDIADRNIDRYVQRTQERPLTAGRLSLLEALVLLFVFSSMALGLALQLNFYAFVLACIGACVTVLYPFTKRYWNAPQAVLGIAFAWGVPMAFAAVQNHLPLSCWLLFFSTMAWIIAYDTEYAMVDREDDRKLGVRSTAIWFGDYDLPIISVLHIVMMLLLIMVGFITHLHPLFYGGLLLASVFLYFQEVTIRSRDRDACFGAFLANHWVGLIVFFSVLFGHLD